MNELVLSSWLIPNEPIRGWWVVVLKALWRFVEKIPMLLCFWCSSLKIDKSLLSRVDKFKGFICDNVAFGRWCWFKLILELEDVIPIPDPVVEDVEVDVVDCLNVLNADWLKDIVSESDENWLIEFFWIPNEFIFGVDDGSNFLSVVFIGEIESSEEVDVAVRIDDVGECWLWIISCIVWLCWLSAFTSA